MLNPISKTLGVMAAVSVLVTGASNVAAQNRLLGLDVSYYQGNLSQATWNGFRTNDNRQFVVIRSSRGGTTGNFTTSTTGTLSQRYDDPYYIQNINRATAAGMFAGTYHFTRPDVVTNTANSGGISNTGTDEADHFMQMASPWMRPGYLPPVNDLEAGQSQRSAEDLAQFCMDFSNRIYEKMRIRPAVYINGSYSSYLQGTSQLTRDLLAKPAALQPSTISPCYPIQWVARWPNGSGNTYTGDIQTDQPDLTYAPIYGPWDDYGTTRPWAFWQYSSGEILSSFGSRVDADVCHFGIEYLKDQFTPAVWWNDSNGFWSTLTNWNSGQTPVMPVPGPGQDPPVGTLTLPTPRLPTSNDTVILERPGTNIIVTLDSGAHNVRKLYVREALNITGGSLAVNFVPAAESTTNGAQFSAPVSLSGTAAMSVHTLQVDTAQTFTLSGGTLTFSKIVLMPGGTPAKLTLNGNLNFNSFTNGSNFIVNGTGAGSSGKIDLGGSDRTLTIGVGSDLSIGVPIDFGALTKAGSGTLRVTGANTYTDGTTVNAGKLFVNNSSGSGTGSGGVTVNGGTLSGSGTISGGVLINSAGTIAPGTETNIGTLTINSASTFNGTNLFRIDRNNGSPLADKIIRAGGGLSFGGTLTVTNIGAALTNGDVFTLFSANSYSGSFTAMNLPALSSDLHWDLGDLIANGTIKVLANVSAPPLITSGPNSATVNAGQSATFSVSATGTQPLVYKWQKNGFDLSNGGNVSGANSAALTLSNASPGDAGSYSVIVTNSLDSVTSSAATLTIITSPPVISLQPQSQTVNAGSNANFSVTAGGTSPMNFQWRLNGSDIANATTSSYAKGNAQPADAGTYSVVITNSYGSATSSDATLTVITSPPVISLQPQSQTVAAGSNANFAVSVSGTAPLRFQWRFNGISLDGATQSSFTMTNVAVSQAGSYSVVVSNAGGTNTSANALLTVNPFFQAAGWNKLWSLGGGSRSYLASANQTERGMAYNVPSNHVLIVSRAVGTNIYVLAGDSGDELRHMNVDLSVVTGGQLGLVMIGTSDDGVVYADNVTLAGGAAAFRIYRWANDGAVTSPTIAFSGDPAPGDSQRWGDTFDVRGSGTNTQILLGSRSGNSAVLLTTTNGTTFTSRVITISDSAAGNFGLGIAFGPANTFWAKAVTMPLRQIAFDLGTGIGITQRSYTNDFPPVISPIGVNPALNLLAGIAMEAPENLKLYSLPTNNAAPVLLAVTNFTTANTNSFYVGAVDFGNDRVYALDPNNGLLAMQIISAVIAPSIAAPPQNQTVMQGNGATFSVAANGTAPLNYQWQFNDSVISGATDSVYNLQNVQTNHAGNYSVVITNSVGSTTSSSAMLTVTVPQPAHFEPATHFAGGQLHMVLSGELGTTNWIDRSFDLLIWEPWTSVTFTSGTIEIVTDVGTNSQSFYRARH